MILRLDKLFNDDLVTHIQSLEHFDHKFEDECVADDELLVARKII